MNQLDTLEPAFRPLIDTLLANLKAMGIDCAVTSGRRTIAEQDRLWLQGRNVDGTITGKIVTRAKGGQSPHNFGLAADLCPRDFHGRLWWDAPDDVWNAMHMVGEQLGLRAGYDFKSIKDAPHFESVDWKLAQAAWKAGMLNVA